MNLDLSSYEKALRSLDKAIKRTKEAPNDEELRDSVILRFEYSYELAWKMLKRQLELEATNPAAIDQLSFKDLIREGAERGFITEFEPWVTYREARNITSHTYDEEKANKVYATALLFYNDAILLLKNLKKRNA